ncbi:terminase small subunit [Vibrio phage vB_VpP_BT-1011]|uniref:Terminase small subunit n=1 Tax=Vibrio phage vB_VpP_BT-1011 TaxID=2799672 RepID=A0A8F2XWM8_9CAUD|nr:terminase small subunit [Vibrio phage vB_VpP_BT-1011]QWX10253.1 terminase small subunit [Vibrio phage vB_VpP_BT-1011]
MASETSVTRMSDEQKELFEKLTPLQQKVAINVISGMSNIDSYRAAGGKSTTQESAEACVSRMLSDAKVKSFVDSMKQEAVKGAVMSRQEMLERLSNLSRVNMSDLISWHTVQSEDDEGNPIEQSVWSIKESAQMDPCVMASISEVTAGKEGFKIKQHSPLAAMKQLADLAGYNETQKVEHTIINKADDEDW